jgi:hypothetical protein
MKTIIEGVRFDSRRHEYWYQRKRVPSVSEIVGLLSLTDKRWYKPWHCQRGSMIHWLTQCVDQGTTDSNEVEAMYAGYLKAYERFLREHELHYDLTEIPMVNPHYLFAGTPDRIGTLDGEHMILDIKSGYPSDDHTLQLGGYWILVGEYTRRRIVLYLRSNGTYSIRYKDLKQYEKHPTLFLTALFCYHQKHGKPLAQFIKNLNERKKVAI